ncbi:MAG: haloacetate dehalogenase [Pseudonocardiales bacterium]|nr:haloacetate dehalogenase [Pseudonocardiales bacterium]
MATAVVNGIRMHYRRLGEGSPIVLLHSWPQKGYAWRHVADDQHRDRARSAWLRPQ